MNGTGHQCTEGDSDAKKRARPPMANPAVGAGMTLAVTVAMFAYGGLWLDRQLGTKPWCMLVLVLIGIVGGMLHLIRVVAPEMWPLGDLKQAALAKAKTKQGDDSSKTKTFS